MIRAMTKMNEVEVTLHWGADRAMSERSQEPDLAQLNAKLSLPMVRNTMQRLKMRKVKRLQM